MIEIFRKCKIILLVFFKGAFYDSLVFIYFGLLAIVMTFPLIFKMNNCIAGFFSTDEPSIWYVWWLKYSHLHHIGSSYSNLIAAPFGADLSIFEILYPVWIGMKKFLAVAFNEFFSYNFEVLSGFILSGFFMYLTLRYLKRSRAASTFSGIIFAFCPYHFARAWQHIGLAHTEWLALFLFAIFTLRDRINWKNIILAFLSLYLVFAFDLYYAFFALVIAAIFVFYLLFYKNKLSLKFIFWLTLISLANIIILAVKSLPILKIDNSVGAWGLVRPFEDLFSQSARPLSYLLPASVHPVFGKLTEGFIGTKIYGMSFTEHTLYLGWVVLFFAFMAFKEWKKKLKDNRLGSEDNFYIGFFLFLAAAAWFFSQPPWWDIFGLKLYMPSFFLYKILPVFRAYCRFGVIVMLAVASLSAFGFDFFWERFKTRKSKIIMAILSYGLVLFDFWNYPPFKIIDFKVPEAYNWLKEQPGDFIIAEYPLDAEGPNELFKFYQTEHEKKIINGTIPGTYANTIAKAITKLSARDTAKTLKSMGVKYVFVHPDDYLNTGLVEETEELRRISNNPDLRFIKRFPLEGNYFQENEIGGNKGGYIDVYELLSLPVESKLKRR